MRKLAQLSRKKNRIEAGQFLVEGPQAVRELLKFRSDEAENIYVCYDSAGFPDIEHLAKESGISLQLVTKPVIEAMTDTVTTQGIVAVARITSSTLADAFEGATLIAVLHEIRDPGNAGTVLRAADAAGADAVVFAGDCIDPWNPKVVRSTTGSLFHLPVVTGVTLEEVAQAAKTHGITTLAADVRGQELSPNDEILQKPVAWVFGNEAHGLTESDRALTDHSVKLPIYGKAESLNLATAASVCLYTTAFAKRQA